jgi:hypothetical protein
VELKKMIFIYNEEMVGHSHSFDYWLNNDRGRYQTNVVRCPAPYGWMEF